MPAPQFTSRASWNIRAAHLTELVLASAGLLPMPERTPLNANVFGDVTRDDYIVSKVYFESLPGFFVTGNSVPADWQWAVPRDPFAARALGVRPFGKFGDRLRSRPRHQPRSPGLRGVHLRHDRLQRQLAARAPGVRRPARKAVGSEYGRTSVVEQHSRAGLSRVAAVRAARQDRRHRRFRRRHAGVSARRGRSASGGRSARQHDFAADAGRLSLRKPARSPPRYDQCRDRRNDCAAASAHGVGHGRLDDQHARARVSRRARAVCAAGRGRSRARRAIRSAP